jgi:hypothetical protein
MEERFRAKAMDFRGGLELAVAFCCPEDGRFLSAPHSISDCTIGLSSNRGNDEVKAISFLM